VISAIEDSMDTVVPQNHAMATAAFTWDDVEAADGLDLFDES
jgi:hypothetical protein